MKETWLGKVEALLDNLGWNYQDLTLYQEALTHSSYAHEKNGRVKHNERLEFLGDAVLELVISEYLYLNYPHLPEGKLTKLRSDLVCEESLFQTAKNLQLGEYLRLGKGEANEGGFARPSLLADAVEALIGALYLDQGYYSCYTCTIRLMEPALDAMDEGGWRRDFKTVLQELLQSQYGITPEYCIAGERGPDHQKLFNALVIFKGEVLGRGWGKSKKEAQQEAARNALEYL